MKKDWNKIEMIKNSIISMSYGEISNSKSGSKTAKSKEVYIKIL